MKKFLIILSVWSLHLTAQIKIELNDSITYQEIVGFGAHGSMNVWWSSLTFYNSTFLDNIVDDLGLTITRNNFYAYNMSQYTDKQKAYYLALKAKAAASNEPIHFIQTVWSPPIEWKANNFVSEGPDPSKNYLLPDRYDDYSNFCADYINTLKTDGIDLYAFSLQNEPAFNEPYESCVYTPTTYNNLLKVAGPIFNSKCPTVKLFGPEDMGSASTTANWTGVIFNDPVTVNYLDALSVHGYSDGVNAATGDATGWSQMYSSAKSKGKQLWMTETSGYSDDWTASTGALTLGKSIYLALKHGKISAWVWWQLGENTTSSVYALMLNGNGTKTKRYYVSKQFYRYIRPGSVQIETNSPDKDVLVTAFKHHGNSNFTATKPQLSIVLINNATSAKTISLNGRNIPATMKAYRTSNSENCVTLADANTSSISLPAQSITTLVYQSANKGPTINQVSNVAIVSSSSPKTISLSNITNGEGSQTGLTITAVCDNKTVIPGAISITPGTGGNYTLNYTPSGVGTATIKVYVKDNGTDIINMTVMEFSIRVIPFVNIAPNVGTINDYVCGYNNKSKKHFIYFSGINDGNDGSQKIDRPLLSIADPTILRLPYVNYVVNETAGRIEFYPDKIGSTDVTLIVKDDGGTDLGGNDTKEVTFKITVVDNYEYVGSEQKSAKPMLAYPNPAKDILTIDLPDNSFSAIQIIDLAGKTLLSKSIDNTTVAIDIRNLEYGIYIVVAIGENGIRETKISIVK